MRCRCGAYMLAPYGWTEEILGIQVALCQHCYERYKKERTQT